MEPPVDMPEDRRVISFSRTKLLLILLFLVIMILAWLFIAVLYVTDSSEPGIVATVIFSISIFVLLIFFGYLAAKIFLRLRDNKPAFIISKTGILWEEAGEEVLWSDVTEITVAEVKTLRGGLLTKKKKVMGIFLIVQNPEHYIDRQKKALQRSMMKQCLNKYGSPIGIMAVGLNVSFDELLKIVKEYYAAAVTA